MNRDVVCQLPPEAGHPPYIAARLKKPSYGMNDAPRRLWNILDKAPRTYGMIPTRADRCCYVLYSIQSRERARDHLGKGPSHSRTIQKMPSLNYVSNQKWRSHSWKSSNRKIRGRNHQSYLWMISLEQVNTKWNNAFLTSLTEISELVQKIGTMLPLQDRGFGGHKIAKTGRILQSVKARPLMSWKKSQWN